MSREHQTQDMDDQKEEDDIHTTTRNAFSIPGHDGSSQLKEEESEDDNEIELELTIEYMSNGCSDMDAEDFAAAEENFRSALELVQEHDFSRKLDYSPGDITLVLADCLARQEKEEEAMELLEPIANGDAGPGKAGSVSDVGCDQITQFKACHTLATIFLRRADTQAAEKRAQQAFKGRRKICGAHDPATLESVQLLIDIYTSKNDKTKARAYHRFLEPSTKTGASTGGPTSTKISATPPVLPPVFQPTATATLTAPAPTTLEKLEGNTSTSTIVPVHQAEKPPGSVPPAHPSATSSDSTRAVSLLSHQPAKRAVPEDVPNIQTVPTVEQERPASQLSESTRAAVQTASTSSTLPSSPEITAKSPSGAVPSPPPPAYAQRPVTSNVLQSDPSTSEPTSAKSSEHQTNRLALVSTALVASSPTSHSGLDHSSPSAQPSADDSKSAKSPHTLSSAVNSSSPAAARSTGDTSAPETQAVPVSQPAFDISNPFTASLPAPASISDATSTVSRSSTNAAVVRASSPVKQSNAALNNSSTHSDGSSVQPAVVERPAQPDVQQPVSTIAPTPPSTDIKHTTTRAESPAATTPSERPSIGASRPNDAVAPVASTAPHVTSTVNTQIHTANHQATTSTTERALPPVPTSAFATNPSAGTMSASRAALASIFASSAAKSSKKSISSSCTESFKTADTAPLPALPSNESASTEETSTVPPVTLPASSPQPKAEIPSFVETSTSTEIPQQEGASEHARTFSWGMDTKLSTPTPAERAMSSSAASANSAAPTQPDPAPVAIAPSGTTKKKAWSLRFGRSGSEAQSKNQTPPSLPPPMPGSAAGTYVPDRSPSVTTLQSNPEAKRLMSLTSSTTSQPPSLRSKEFSFSIEKLPRPSISRSYSSSTQPGARTRQELGPRFAMIKALRAEGKKSASVDAAIKLLREYDAEKKIMVIRESELKKNMKESHKGLASTGNGYAPIHFFCEQKAEAAIEVELLIEQGVDVNAVACKAGMPGQEPFTPLQRAIEHGHAEIVRLLVEADVAIAPPRPQKGPAAIGNTEPLTSPLLIACTRGHTQITHILLKGGAARQLKEFPHHQWHGNSLLHEACWLADTVMVRMLLDQLKTVRSEHHASAGPDYDSGVIGAPGQQDRFGATPIMYAIDLRDCTSQRMRLQKSARRKECLKLLLEHDIHGDLHSHEYRDNIGRVLSTKWTRGPGKGHSIFCYCDEAGDEELIRILDPFRFQVAPGMRCHATPQCTSLSGSSIRSGSVKSGATDRQNRVPDFPELMSSPVSWPVSAGVDGGHYELASNFDTALPQYEQAIAGQNRMVGGNGEPISPATGPSNGHVHGHAVRGRLSELSETSEISRVQVV